MKKFLGLVGILVALVLVAWGVAIGTRTKSPLSGDVANDPALVARGEKVAIQGDCTACHTKKGSDQFYAGGYPFPLPMGKIYSPNISSDPSDGIGNWTLAEFDNAVRFGVSKVRGNLYPAMPYVSYSKVSDEDIKALYAYFKYGTKPQQIPNKPEKIVWPLNLRWPVQLWNDLFSSTTRYVPDSSQGDVWNRGAYLVQGLAHCGTCHTPRGIAMQQVALDQSKKHYLGGSVVGGWLAFNITSDETAGIGSWSQDQLETYLHTGNVPGLAQAAGGMAEAVEHSFSKMDKADITAIATYVKTVPASRKGDKKQRSSLGIPSDVVITARGDTLSLDVPQAIAKSTTYSGKQAFAGDRAALQDKDSTKRGEILFLGACAACHRWNGAGHASGYYPSLFKNSAVGSKNLTNLTQVVLHGLKRKTADADIMMPGFADNMSNSDVADLVTWISHTFGDGSTGMTADKVKSLR